MSKSDLQPLISVIIPTYNRGDLIFRAINSVWEQSYGNLEIIVVDDHSQDHTPDIIQKIADSRLHYCRHETNLGGSAARNTGIKQAKGQYIAFLDSDDVWLPHKLETQLEAINQQDSHLEPVVCYSKFQKSDPVFYQPGILPHRGKQPQETVADYLWLGGGEILTSTILVSRTLATADPFATGLPKHQDLDVVLRWGFQGAEFIFVPQVLTIWHNEPRRDRISRGRNYQVSLDWIETYQEKISQPAYQGFLLKEVAPKMLLFEDTKTAGIKLLFQGLRAGIMPLHYFLFLIIKQSISPKLQQSFKKLLQKIKLLNKP